MWTYEHAVESTAPADAVRDVWSDIRSWPQWNPGIRSITVDGPMAPGTTFTMIGPPDDEAITLTVVAVEPGLGFTDRFDGGDVVVTTHHEAEPIGTGSRVTYRTEISGAAADEVGPQLGPEITADFPDVVAALVDRARRPGP